MYKVHTGTFFLWIISFWNEIKIFAKTASKNVFKKQHLFPVVIKTIYIKGNVFKKETPDFGCYKQNYKDDVFTKLTILCMDFHFSWLTEQIEPTFSHACYHKKT